MKKVLSLILVLVLCLALCACGEDPVATDDRYAKYDELLQYLEDGDYAKAEEYIQKLYESVTNPTDPAPTDPEPTDDPEKKERYETALYLLTGNFEGAEGLAYQEAYRIFTELGDYKDSQEYLARFTIIPDALLSITQSLTNDFGEITSEHTMYYQYDSQGRIILMPTVERVSRACSYYGFKYDNNGRIEERYEGSGRINPYYTTLYTYDGEILIEEKMMYNRNGTTEYIKEYTYGEDGQLINEETKDSYGSIRCMSYTYENGLLIKTEKETDEGLTETCYFNQDGLLVRKEDTGGRGYTYTYENGLLIMEQSDHGDPYMYTYENGRKLSVEYRNITWNYTYGDYYCYTPAE